MFNFLKSKKTFIPLTYELRKYLEHNLLWLEQQFPEPKIEERKIFVPTATDFPIRWNKSRKNAIEVLNITCAGMNIDINEIEIEFYSNGLKEINMGSSTLFIQTDPDNPDAAGLFHDRSENGKFQISLDEAIVEKPEGLVATIAHELAHIKLLGEKRITENDEYLTDLTTAFFGFGIFNANQAFQFVNQNDRWSYSKLGYLKVDEWAYSLALMAFMRNEEKPDWDQYLSNSVSGYFQKCLKYMYDNKEEIFRLDEKELDNE